MRARPLHDPLPIADEQLSSLVTDFRNGSIDAFKKLYLRYENPIYRFCKHITGDDSFARDAFQETFIRMFEHRTELRSDNIQSWLFTIARRVCLNILRTRRAHHEQFDEKVHDHDEPMHTDVLLREHLHNAIQQLAEPLRSALILRDIEGYTYQEIADIVGIDLSLAKVRVYRARLHLRKILLPIVTERQRSV